MEMGILEVPGGGPEKDETPEQPAERRLGGGGLKVKKLISLGQVFPAPGWNVETQYHFIAECMSDVRTQTLDQTENIERRLIPASKVREMLKQRKIGISNRARYCTTRWSTWASSSNCHLSAQGRTPLVITIICLYFSILIA